MSARPLAGRVALVTGANHGIGAAAAVALGELGADVALTYLRLSNDDDDPGRPPEYARFRRQGPDATVESVIAAGGAAHAVEADLSDPDAPAQLFDEVEHVLGPVAILVHNASGWRKDTFTPEAADRFDRRTERVSAATFDTQFHVDARGRAAHRRVRDTTPRSRRRLGPRRHAHLGRSERVPRRGLLRGGEGRARELHDVGGDRARADGHHRQRRVPGSDRHRMGDRRRPPLRGRERRPCARRHSARGGRR